MTWLLACLNISVATLIATLQLLVLYRYRLVVEFQPFIFSMYTMSLQLSSSSSSYSSLKITSNLINLISIWYSFFPPHKNKILCRFTSTKISIWHSFFLFYIIGLIFVLIVSSIVDLANFCSLFQAL